MTDIKIPGFDLIELIGRGGMAEVWKARQVSLDRVVAIKILSNNFVSDSSDVDRFQEEARAAARLKHLGVVQVYDASTADGLYYFVMEYVAGYTVGSWLRRKGVLDEADALVVCECVADALDYAWTQARIIHCDIKPDNIIIDADGTVKVADLGLSRTINAMSRVVEETEEVMGTPSYISPEQAMGSPDLDNRADVYSLGAMLYHLVTGQRPFEGYPDSEVMELQCTGELPAPLAVVPALSVPLSMLLEKMMAKEKEHRHTDWQEVKADIARVKRGHPPRAPLSAAAVTTVARSPRTKLYRRPDLVHGNLQRWKKRDSSSMLALAIVGGLFLLLLLIWFVAHVSRPPRYFPPTAVPPRTVPIQDPTPQTTTRDQRAAEVFGEVRAWVAAHPTEWQESRRRLGEARERAAGTRFVVDIDRELTALGQRQANAMQRVHNQLREQASPLETAGRWREAIAVYSDYRGELVDETLRWRLQMASAVRNRAAATETVVDPPQETPAVLDLDETMNRVVDTLITTGPGAAALVVRQAVAGGEAGPHATRLARLERVLIDAAQLERRVMQSFEDSIAKEISVHLESGIRRVYIGRIADGRVYGSSRRASSGVVKLPISFGIEDLYITERLKRMGDDAQPEVALGKGIMALHANALSRAHDFFARTHELLAGRLQDYVARKLKGEAAVSPDAGRAVPPPPPVADVAPTVRAAALPRELEPVRDDVAGVRGLLLSKNPRMNPAHLIIELADGKAVTVRIASGDVMDIGPLAALTTLTTFILDAPRKTTAPLKNIDALENLPLTRVVLDRSRVADLGALKDAPLVSLSVRRTSVQSLSPLRGKHLKHLDVADSSVLDIGPLAGMPLEYLDVSDTSVRRLGVLSGMPLKVLEAGNTPLLDLTALAGLHLSELAIADTSVRDISVVSSMPLARLDISRTPISNLSPLEGLGLTELALSGVPVVNFAPLKELKLVHLDVSKTSFSDIGMLAGMPLRSLSCHDTRVADLWALSGKHLTSLNIENTGVSDLSALKDAPLEHLACRRSRVTDFAPVRAAPIKRLFIDNPLRQSRFIRSLDKLTFLNGENLLYATESPFRRTALPE